MEDFTNFTEKIDAAQKRYENASEGDTAWLQKLRHRFEKMGGWKEFVKLKEVLNRSLECIRIKEGFSYCDKDGVEMYAIKGEFISRADVLRLSEDNRILEEIRNSKDAEKYLFIKNPAISLLDGTCFVGELSILAIDMNDDFDFFSGEERDDSPARSLYMPNDCSSLVALDFNPDTVIKFYVLMHELGHIYSYTKGSENHSLLRDDSLNSVMHREHLANEFGFEQVRSVFSGDVDESSLQLMKAYQEAHYAELLIDKHKETK